MRQKGIVADEIEHMFKKHKNISINHSSFAMDCYLVSFFSSTLFVMVVPSLFPTPAIAIKCHRAL